jgi:hypothetical protein
LTISFTDTALKIIEHLLTTTPENPCPDQKVLSEKQAILSI